MLVLSRKTQQSIQIGNEIVITVVHVRNSKVKLGFECPRNISVRRFELAGEEFTEGLKSETAGKRESQATE
ncbi:carbon storage regulator [Gimesia panareensis]|uniref:carbon storage regulator n=1 Tax=Gimesia panareensis TaxID=2527978 RepID=UPI0011A10CEF|nr:carbon storage regulator [Gimesia panareensis]